MLHKALTVGDNHIIHNWVVADAAARTALIVAATDVGKVALQSDSNTMWVLLDHTIPTWKDLTTGVVPDATIVAALLAGLSTADATAVTATDSILIALGKLQARSAILPTKVLPIACSDETTSLSAGGGKVTFRMPFPMTLTAVRASLTTAQASGALFTVDINEAGVSILSTKLTIDNTEKTSTTAVAAAVISDAALADDAEISIDLDAVGDGTAKGLKVYLIGT